MQTNANSQPNPDEKGFTLIRTDAIQLAVWLEGYTPIEDQPLKSLSEDISYRIREALDVLFEILLVFAFFLFKIFFLECRQLYATLQTFQIKDIRFE